MGIDKKTQFTLAIDLCVIYINILVNTTMKAIGNQQSTLFRMEGPKSGPAHPYQFFPCNFYKRRNYLPNLSDF